MSDVFLESWRLYLRQMVMDDIKDIYRLDSDLEIMKYIGPPVADIDSLKPRVERTINQYKLNTGFGLWVAVEKQTNAVIGWFCLKNLDNTAEIEVGYRLLKEFWGKGYATEMSKKLLEYGFKIKKLDEIVGITHPDHVASQNVLKKIGLSYIKDAHYYSTDVKYFAVTKEQYFSGNK